MIDDQIYKKTKKYAKKFAKKENDIDDITQESFLMLLEYPSVGKKPNKFYFQLARRAAYNFYYRPRINKKPVPRQRESMLGFNEYRKLCNSLIDDRPLPEEICGYKEVINLINSVSLKSRSHQKKGISTKEREILDLILLGVDLEYKHRTHYSNLVKKLRNFYGAK